jgi:hypothetical protein
MAYCGPKGIPLSQFLGWSNEDQDAALVWAAHESRRCAGCGTHPDDWDEAAGGSRHAYKGEPYQCEGCVVAERTAESPDMQQPQVRGMRVRLVRG